MAGHHKWSMVKHIEAGVDAVKGRVFGKCAHDPLGDPRDIVNVDTRFEAADDRLDPRYG